MHALCSPHSVAQAIPGSVLLLVVALALGGCDSAIKLTTDPWTPANSAAEAKPIAPRSECRDRVAHRQPLFGDLHVHTGVSMDARSLGTLASPDNAYRYAQGEPIDVFSGDPAIGMRSAQIDRPLDFAAVTDHAEWMAEVSLCSTPGSPTYDSDGCKIYRGEEEGFLSQLLGLKGFRARIGGLIGISGRRDDVCGSDDSICRAELKTVWKANQEATERNYDRSADCRFTTFHAWEYSHSPQSTKLHRNIVLRNEIGPELPISSLETPIEMDLRQQLVDLCNDTDTGCEAIAIPHNPNLSNGQMFAIEYADLPIEEQRKQAALRARLEPIVEMMQIKGESECRNGMWNVLGEPDEYCGFEKIRDLGGQDFEDCEEGSGAGAQNAKGCSSRTDFVRYALLEGVRERKRIGVNPYAFGFIGSTDNHMATPGGVSETGVPLKFGTPPDALLAVEGRKRGGAFWNPGGLAGVWAEANQRDSIFDALKRRESFATSGPRIAPRFFGGWNLDPNLCAAPDFAGEGYAQGVPMGGVLPSATAAASSAGPMFAVSALADPGTRERAGGKLQQLQIIKGWVDADGLFHQKVVVVAGGADNQADVNPATCEPRGEGALSLCGVWQDPEFDRKMDAVYYARVLENPSCRWSAQLCLDLAESNPEVPLPDGCSAEALPQTIQERAWTSPIQYVADATESVEVVAGRGGREDDGARIH